ncbi:hypothetical protein [Rhodoferax sp.]|uniref:hypothetical protein n=1 Tax=Rhodoferax sp. TaxID=50421 RepID=UPI0026033027|nr:hypothetical protein [Rhodoferax sp.]MDD3936085.1 hypothetical protein [Rhodoferax sp.]
MRLHQKFFALALTGSVLLPLVLVTAPTAAQIPQADSRFCGYCGTVAAVNLIAAQGQGGHPGGSVLGALLTSQADDGRSSKYFEVVVRMQNGSLQTVTYATEPGFKAGDKVHIIDGLLVHQP